MGPPRSSSQCHTSGMPIGTATATARRCRSAHRSVEAIISPMKNPQRSVPEQIALSRAWLAAQTQGVTQVVFCGRQQPPLSVRTLRAYARRHAPSAPPLAVALAVVDRAIRDLQDLRASIADGRAGPTDRVADSTFSVAGPKYEQGPAPPIEVTLGKVSYSPVPASPPVTLCAPAARRRPIDFSRFSDDEDQP